MYKPLSPLPCIQIHPSHMYMDKSPSPVYKPPSHRFMPLLHCVQAPCSLCMNPHPLMCASSCPLWASAPTLTISPPPLCTRLPLSHVYAPPSLGTSPLILMYNPPLLMCASSCPLLVSPSKFKSPSHVNKCLLCMCKPTSKS